MRRNVELICKNKYIPKELKIIINSYAYAHPCLKEIQGKSWRDLKCFEPIICLRDYYWINSAERYNWGNFLDQNSVCNSWGDLRFKMRGAEAWDRYVHRYLAYHC